MSANAWLSIRPNGACVVRFGDGAEVQLGNVFDVMEVEDVVNERLVKVFREAFFAEIACSQMSELDKQSVRNAFERALGNAAVRLLDEARQ